MSQFSLTDSFAAKTSNQLHLAIYWLERTYPTDEIQTALGFLYEAEECLNKTRDLIIAASHPRYGREADNPMILPENS